MQGGRNVLQGEENLYFIGFMGAGKTTVARIVAEKLRRQFYDTDSLIEKQEDRTISEIFSQSGEAYFRRVESKVIEDVASHRQLVVALGGGAPLKESNRKRLQNSGVTIYLRWELDTLLPRIINDRTRPLLDGLEERALRSEVAAMLSRREPIYATADLIINCGENSRPDEIANELIMTLQER